MQRCSYNREVSKKDFRFGISRSLKGVDLNRLLIAHPPSSFYFRLVEDINDLNLETGDVLLVDRALTPKSNDIVIVSRQTERELYVLRFNEARNQELELWGTVEHVIRRVKT